MDSRPSEVGRCNGGGGTRRLVDGVTTGRWPGGADDGNGGY